MVAGSDEPFGPIWARHLVLPHGPRVTLLAPNGRGAGGTAVATDTVTLRVRRLPHAADLPLPEPASAGSAAEARLASRIATTAAEPRRTPSLGAMAAAVKPTFRRPSASSRIWGRPAHSCVGRSRWSASSRASCGPSRASPTSCRSGWRPICPRVAPPSGPYPATSRAYLRTSGGCRRVLPRPAAQPPQRRQRSQREARRRRRMAPLVHSGPGRPSGRA